MNFEFQALDFFLAFCTQSTLERERMLIFNLLRGKTYFESDPIYVILKNSDSRGHCSKLREIHL